MKKIALVFVFSACYLSAQNPFLDGINQAKEVGWKEGNKKFSALAFQIDLSGTCGARYVVTEIWFDNGIETSYKIETTWNWIDVASIEVDTIRSILRFNSRNPMPCSKEDVYSKEIEKDPDNVVLNIYFKDKTSCLNAAHWALDHVKTCGGKAQFIN